MTQKSTDANGLAFPKPCWQQPFLDAVGIEPYHIEDAGIIWCADCMDVLPKLPEKSVDLVLTDPPYGMNMNPDNSRFSGGHNPKKRDRGFSDRRKVFGDDAPPNMAHILRFDNIVTWGLNHYPDQLYGGSAFVWIKRNDDAFGSFLSDAEIAWYSKGRGVYCFRDFSLNGEVKSRAHPTQKPTKLMCWCIVKAGKGCDLICDPFMGSGTTCVAAKQLGRKFIGIEIEEKYCKIAVDRLRQEELFA